MKDKSGNDIVELQINVGGERKVIYKYRKARVDSPKAPLSDETIIEIVRAAAKNDIHHITLTGDDPLDREGIVELCSKIKETAGIDRLSLTTNGIALSDNVEALKTAGLDDVNIKLDTLKYTAYEKLVENGELDKIIPSINAAVNAKVSPVTLIVHIFEGINDTELMDFLQLTFQHKYRIVFREFAEEGPDEFKSVTEAAIREKMPALRTTLQEGETVQLGEIEYFKYPIGVGKIGFDSPLTSKDAAGRGIAVVDEDGRLRLNPYAKESEDVKAALGM